MTTGLIKEFTHYVRPYAGWFWDENGARKNLSQLLTSLLGATTISSNLEGKGNITIGTSQVELNFTGTTRFIRIRADIGNSGVIYIGKTGVLSNGTNDFARLYAGDEITIPYNDSANPLYAISGTASQKINVGALL